MKRSAACLEKDQMCGEIGRCNGHCGESLAGEKMVIGGDSMGKQDATFKEHGRINGFVAAVCKQVQ